MTRTTHLGMTPPPEQEPLAQTDAEIIGWMCINMGESGRYTAEEIGHTVYRECLRLGGYPVPTPKED